MIKNLKFIIPVTVIFVVMVLIKMFTPEPTDWNPSYSKNDKIPFGSYILFDLMEDIFRIEKLKQQIFHSIIL
jgi:hypothetical protein